MSEFLNLKKNQKGFTLVELAIVMIIIGLLIGGVLKGQELIGNAQVTATISQMRAYDAAITTFRDQYNSPPGDLVNAANRLPNCTAAPCNAAAAGNLGDGQITADPGVMPAATSEGTVAWSHLAAADLISGVNIIAESGAVNLNDELPSGKIGGTGFFIGYAGNAASVTGELGTTSWRGGHYLGLSNGRANIGAGGAGAQALTAGQAARIDLKLDDGRPNTGTIRAGGVGACVSATTNTGIYVESVTEANCALFIRIQG